MLVKLHRTDVLEVLDFSGARVSLVCVKGCTAAVTFFVRAPYFRDVPRPKRHTDSVLDVC